MKASNNGDPQGIAFVDCLSLQNPQRVAFVIVQTGHKQVEDLNSNSCLYYVIIYVAPNSAVPNLLVPWSTSSFTACCNMMGGGLDWKALPRVTGSPDTEHNEYTENHHREQEGKGSVNTELLHRFVFCFCFFMKLTQLDLFFVFVFDGVDSTWVLLSHTDRFSDFESTPLWLIGQNPE